MSTELVIREARRRCHLIAEKTIANGLAIIKAKGATDEELDACEAEAVVRCTAEIERALDNLRAALEAEKK